MHVYPWQELLWRQLLKAPTPPQALLIAGAAGRGKADFAHSYAGHLLKTPPEKHPDFYPLSLEEKEKSISVESIRELTLFLQQGCQLAERKVVLINPAEKLTKAAQQAFLKTLEEPVTQTTFIIVTSELEKLLPTVKSRCQTIHMKPVPFATAASWLAGQGNVLTEEEYALTAYSPLQTLTEEFTLLKKMIVDLENNENLKYDKIDPEIALSAHYFQTVNKIKTEYDKKQQQKYYAKLDKIQQLKQKYSEIPGLNMNMQLSALESIC